MISRRYISELKDFIGQNVTICGFVNTIRNQGGIKFVLIRDNTGFIQCVVLKSNNVAFNLVEEIFNESVLKVSGLLKEERQAPSGYEILVEELEVLSRSHAELPIPVNQDKIIDDVEISKRLDYRWLDLRDLEKLKIFKTWTYFEEGFKNQALKENFIQIYTPSFMSSPSESGAEVFEVKYFDKKAYLAQSPQFYKQMAMASGFDRVFISNPVFRAEPSYTTRHMTEFTGWDFEVSYIENHHDIMDFEERFIISGFENLNSRLNLNLSIPKAPFPRISLNEVKRTLKDLGIDSEKENNLSPIEERKISEFVKEKFDSDFVFITDYPVTARPFYHMRHPDNLKLTMSFDLLYKGVEITTGAQREHRYEKLKEQAIEKNMISPEIENYLEFFKFGCPPHGGVGIGPGRIIMQILNLHSVKEATFLPRDVKRLTP